MKVLLTNSQLKQLSFLIIIVFTMYLVGKELIMFIPSFLGALTLYILTRRLHKRLLSIKKIKPWMARVLILLIALISILIPVYFFGVLIYSKLGDLKDYPAKLTQSIKNISEYLSTTFNIDIFDSSLLKDLSGFLASNVSGVINSGLNILTTIFFSFFIFYFMLTNASWLENQFFIWMPMKKEDSVRVRERFYRMVFSNAIGIPLVAFVQAIAGFIGYWIIGLEDIWFWFLITFFASAVPIVGSALAYVPIAIIYFANGQTYEGVFTLIWGTVVIGSVDNIFRFTLLERLDNIHPLITVFGIIVGLNLFGFLGLIFGPLLISLLFILIDIYREEYPDNVKIIRK
ncbi:MAG: AI-2E family transporter [Flavobacteriales bacterium]|nr:AI-2E family transporter [Flavobacteriales bacterium]